MSLPDILYQGEDNMDENIFNQLKGYVAQLEQMSKQANEKFNPNYKREAEQTQARALSNEYDMALESEYIKSQEGQAFAQKQIELAQTFLVMQVMKTPEGAKLAEERAASFAAYKDKKMKEFLDSRKEAKQIKQTETLHNAQ